jgi:hypothetical protein
VAQGRPEAWVGVRMEILERINKQSFLLAHAIMHTTGQAFVMAFQAGGRMRRIAASRRWRTRGTR